MYTTIEEVEGTLLQSGRSTKIREWISSFLPQGHAFIQSSGDHQDQGCQCWRTTFHTQHPSILSRCQAVLPLPGASSCFREGLLSNLQENVQNHGHFQKTMRNFAGPFFLFPSGVVLDSLRAHSHAWMASGSSELAQKPDMVIPSTVLCHRSFPSRSVLPFRSFASAISRSRGRGRSAPFPGDIATCFGCPSTLLAILWHSVGDRIHTSLFFRGRTRCFFFPLLGSCLLARSRSRPRLWVRAFFSPSEFEHGEWFLLRFFSFSHLCGHAFEPSVHATPSATRSGPVARRPLGASFEGTSGRGHQKHAHPRRLEGFDAPLQRSCAFRHGR